MTGSDLTCFHECKASVCSAGGPARQVSFADCYD